MFAINEPVYQWYDKKADCRTDQHGRDHGDGKRFLQFATHVEREQQRHHTEYGRYQA